MIEFKVYNLDHGFNKEKAFRVGDYEITISKEQAENISSLEKNGSRSFITDGNLERHIENTNFTSGGVFETATIKLKEEKKLPSVIYSELPDRSTIDDFVLFLSFVTGRRVFLEKDLEPYLSTKYGNSAVNKNFFHFPSASINDGFELLVKLKLTTPFYNLVHLKTINDLPAMCFYVNTIVNTLYERWCKENDKSKFPPNSICVDSLKQHLRSKLEDDNTPNEVISDVVARFNIHNQPSAMYKLEQFLIGIGLMESNPSEEVISRLRWINKVRNYMAHSGDVPSDKNIGFIQRAEITTNITFILIAISEYYFSKVIFKIDNYSVEQNAKEIRKYFESGIFNGHKVFDETYSEFIERQDAEWIENGKYV